MAARLPKVFAALVAMAALGGGCGGDDDSGVEITTSSLSKDAFVKKANAICARGREQALSFVRRSASGPESRIVAKGVEEDVVPAFRQVAADLEALGAPKGDEATIEALVEAMNEGTDKLENGSPVSLAALAPPFEPSAKLARDYGIAGCAYAR